MSLCIIEFSFSKLKKIFEKAYATLYTYLDFLTAPYILVTLPAKGREYFGLSGV